MTSELSCLRCGNLMEFIKNSKIQLGQSGVFLGQTSNYIAGGLETDIYKCDECGKLEFFQIEDDQIEQIKCPNCGKTHDMDYLKCPFCKYNYYNK